MTASTQPLPAPRLAIVLSHATQYYSPWFRWLKANTSLTFRVFYLSEFGLKAARDEKFDQTFAWDVDLSSGYDWETVPNRARVPDTLRFSGLHNPEITARLAAWKPDAVLLFGYKYRTHLRLIAWARTRRLPLIFRGDSHLLGRPRLSVSKRWLLSLVYRQFAAVTYVGEANREYFHQLGVGDEKLFFAPHAVNAAHFDLERTQPAAQAEELRRQLGLSAGTRVVLFAGKLIPQKQPRALLDAFLAVAPPDAAIVFVGDGPESAGLRAEAAKHPGAPVHFLPFANQSEMPARYRLADLFVLPSRGSYETWGLSINEAMHLGVPCLVSDRVGCQRDLVTDGKTGWVFAADEPGALQAKLVEALRALALERTALRSAVLRRISGYTYVQASAGLMAAVHCASGLACPS